MTSTDYAYSPKFIQKALQRIALKFPSFALDYLYRARRLYDTSEADEKERRILILSGREIIGIVIGRVILERFEEGSLSKFSSVHQILGGERSLELILGSCVDQTYCLDEWRIWFGLFYKMEGWDALLLLLKDVYEPLLAMVSSRLDEDTQPEDASISDRYHGRHAITSPESREILIRTRRHPDVRNKENCMSSNGGRTKQVLQDEEIIPRSLTLMERVDGTLNSRAALEQPSLLSRLDPHPDADAHGPRGLLTRMGLSSPGRPHAIYQRSNDRRRRAR